MDDDRTQKEHFNFDEIVELVRPNSKVLDLGCGDCTLLARLVGERGATARGVDIENAMLQRCIDRGVSVFHGDLDEGLKDHPTGSYDYVILSRTLQMVHSPRFLLQEMIRVGNRVIVNFPNFAYVTNRLQLMLGGRMPVNSKFPYQWYNTPNIHFFTYRDFVVLCRELGVPILKQVFLRNGRRVFGLLPNMFATEVRCLLDGESARPRRSV